MQKPRIRHIALNVQNRDELAEYYKKIFGLEEKYRGPNGTIYLSDGFVGIALIHRPELPWGINHFGFEVENLDEACEKLQAAQGKSLTQKDNLDTMMAPGSHRNFEMKWAGPDGVVLDISHTGWDGTSA